MEQTIEKQGSEELFKKALQEGTIEEQDGRYALEFIQKYNSLKSNSKGSVLKYYYCLRSFLSTMKAKGMTLTQMSEDEAYELFNTLKNSHLSEDSRFNYWKAFIRFYKWAAKRYGQDWNEAVKGLMYANDQTERLQYKIDKNKVTKKSTFSDEEVVKLVTSDPNLCYKVLWGVLFDSAMRGGEAFSIKLRGVEKVKGQRPGELDHYVLSMEKSKTRIRPTVIEPGTSISITYLEQWLAVHPRKNDLEAPLFCNTLGKPLKASAANKALKVLVKQIAESLTDNEQRKAWSAKTKISLHSFRHSRATSLANRGMSGELMAALVGWTPGSKMPSVYIRASQLDAQAALRRAYGLEKPQEQKMQVKTCVNCHTPNPLDSNKCSLCHLPLNPDEVSKLMQDMAVQKDLEERFKQLEEAYEKKIELSHSRLINEIAAKIKANG